MKRFVIWFLGSIAAPMAIVVAVAGVFTAGFANGGTLRADDAQFTVKEIVNRVETQRHRDPTVLEVDFRLAQLDQDLVPGDAVKTYKNSEARVDITVQELTRITRTRPNTIWRLGAFVVDKGAVIELDQGKIFLFDGNQNGAPLDVVTPAGRATPRGTWLSVSHDPDTGITEVQCFRGTCELENKYGTLVLTDEQKTTVSPSSAPAAPVFLDIDDTLEFVNLPEAKSGE